jgi:hypothetical protein
MREFFLVRLLVKLTNVVFCIYFRSYSNVSHHKLSTCHSFMDTHTKIPLFKRKLLETNSVCVIPRAAQCSMVHDFTALNVVSHCNRARVCVKVNRAAVHYCILSADSDNNVTLQTVLIIALLEHKTKRATKLSSVVLPHPHWLLDLLVLLREHASSSFSVVLSVLRTCDACVDFLLSNGVDFS